jgi:hypothetical protein
MNEETTPGTPPHPWLEHLHDQIDRSRFYAARGARPPTREIRNIDEFHRVLVRVFDAARVQILDLHDPLAPKQGPDPTPHRQAEWNGLDIAVLQRGVAIRLLTTHQGYTATDLETARINALSARGATTRLTDMVPFNALIIDRTTALLPPEPGVRTLRDGALLVHDPTIVWAVHASLAALWPTARPILQNDQSAAPRHLQPVLDTLLDGLTDVAAARLLGISPRTYSRRITELLHELGATSRAQAGAEARARGWTARR